MQSRADLRLVTPEAVVLDIETAGLGSRMLSALIDLAIQVVLVIGLFIVLAAFSDSGLSTVVAVIAYAAVFMIPLGYPAILETVWRGRTVGKAAMGLRVVTREGSPIRFRHAAIRAALGLIDLYITSGAAAVLAVLFSRNNQRLGDMVAGTLVIRERSGARAPTAVTFPIPYGYEAYAATLDVSGLTGSEYVGLRSFLLRAATLPVPVRQQLALQLAQPLAARMHHTPAQGVSPEIFLASVVSTYQRRSAPVTVPVPGASLLNAPPPVAPPPWVPSVAPTALPGADVESTDPPTPTASTGFAPPA